MRKLYLLFSFLFFISFFNSVDLIVHKKNDLLLLECFALLENASEYDLTYDYYINGSFVNGNKFNVYITGESKQQIPLIFGEYTIKCCVEQECSEPIKINLNKYSSKYQLYKKIQSLREVVNKISTYNNKEKKYELLEKLDLAEEFLFSYEEKSKELINSVLLELKELKENKNQGYFNFYYVLPIVFIVLLSLIMGGKRRLGGKRKYLNFLKK